MPAVRVAQAPGSVVVFGEEERGVGALVGILVKELVHGTQQALGFVEGDRALAAKIRLQIGHQKSRGHSLARDIGDYQPEAPAAQVEKIVVIAAHLAGLDASARIFDGFDRRQSLREEPGLYLFGNLQFLCGAAFRFQLRGKLPALRFDLPIDLVEAHQLKRVSVHIPEPGEDPAPNRGPLFGRRSRRRPLQLEAPQAGRGKKLDAAPAPILILGEHIFGNDHNPGRPADELVLPGLGRGRDQRKNSGAVGGRDRYPPVAGLQPGVESQIESELVYEEPYASILVPNEDLDGVKPEKRLPVRAARCVHFHASVPWIGFE